MLKIRRSSDRLIFNMEIPVPGSTLFILKRGPGYARMFAKVLTRQNQCSIHCVPLWVHMVVTFPFYTLDGRGKMDAILQTTIW